jgi:hypothetical protein
MKIEMIQVNNPFCKVFTIENIFVNENHIILCDIHRQNHIAL